MPALGPSTRTGQAGLFYKRRRRRSRQDISAYRALIASPPSFGSNFNFTALSRAQIGIRVTGSGAAQGAITLNGEATPALPSGAIHRFSNIPVPGRAMTLSGSTSFDMEVFVLDALGNRHVIGIQT